MQCNAHAMQMQMKMQMQMQCNAMQCFGVPNVLVRLPYFVRVEGDQPSMGPMRSSARWPV
eukprot:2758006-Lingulodinium_polyedra.AAC.1